MIGKMAFKNLFRHKKRTILTLITTIVGVLLAIVGEGLNSGLERQVTDISIKSEISYGRIFGKNFYEDKENDDILEYPIENNVLNKLKGIPISKRISFTGSITDSKEELMTYFMGVNKDEENKIFQRSNYIIYGNFLNNKNDIVVGEELAKLLNLKLGDEITIMARTTMKSQNAYDLKITGIIKTGNPIFDGKAVFLNQDFAKEFIGADFYNEIIVGEMLDNSVRDKLKSMCDYVSYKEELKDLLAIAKLRRKIFGTISGAIMVMASLTITNTMLMAMLERKKEIGVLMANGMNSKNILKLFFTEGLLNGLFGCIIGFLVGSFITIYLSKNGIPFNVNSNDVGISLPFSDKFYLYYNFYKSLIFPLIGLIFISIASFYPAYKATELNPIEAIKG
jgi:putative ABC transport system permease protein